MDAPGLTVRAVPLRHLLLMKLHRAEPADLDDIRRIWTMVASQFVSAEHLVEAYYESFPLAAHDEYLAPFVVEQLELGGFHLPLR